MQYLASGTLVADPQVIIHYPLATRCLVRSSRRPRYLSDHFRREPGQQLSYMAVVAPPPLLKSKLDLWESSESAIHPAVPPSAPMTDIMSYQYPPPPQNGADMDMSPSGYYPNYSVSSHTSSGMDSGVPSRDRSDSMKIKRSLSTPAVGPSPSQAPAPQSTASQQSTAQGQDPLGLAGEKRRNKLGYHRTSVACGKSRPLGSCEATLV